MVRLGYVINFLKFCNHLNCHVSRGQIACCHRPHSDSHEPHIKSSSNPIPFCHISKHGLKYYFKSLNPLPLHHSVHAEYVLL